MATATTVEDQVKEALELIRPAIQADGGDIRLEGIADGVVTVQFFGTCGTCPISMQTLKAGVERIIKDRVPGVTAVEDDGAPDAT